jgi:hypothetical protein
VLRSAFKYGRSRALYSQRFISRAKYPAVGVMLLPILAGLGFTLWQVVRQIPYKNITALAVAAGIACYAVIELVFKKPLGLYVFGHELSHAGMAMLFGHRVKSMKVSARGGEVALSGTNVWIALAPYLFPIFTLIVVGLLLLVRHYSTQTISPPWMAFAVGLTFAFHISLTVHAVIQDQPDLRHAGPFLSLVMILLANGLIFAVLLKLLFPESVSLKIFMTDVASGTWLFLRRIALGSLSVLSWAMGKSQ